MKRGIMELADLVVVNKADGDLLPAARRLTADYTSALKLLNTSRKDKLWTPRVSSFHYVYTLLLTSEKWIAENSIVKFNTSIRFAFYNQRNLKIAT